MLNFDELMVQTLRIHPNVKSVHRVDNGNVMGLYFVEVEDGCEAAVSAVIKDRVHPDLSFSFGRIVGGRELWSRATKPSGPPPLNDLISSMREALLAERNKLILEGVAAETLAGYVFDVSDPCCPPKFKEMVGGDAFIKHCRAGGNLPLAVGVMPKRLLSKHIEPIARKVEKMPAPMIFIADVAVPKTVRLLEGWNESDSMVVVTGYQRALGLKSITVPALVKLS